MSGVDLRKIILPNLRLVAIQKMRLEPRDPPLDQLQVVVSQLSTFKKCLETAGETVKLLQQNQSINRKLTFILLCIFVSLC